MVKGQTADQTDARPTVARAHLVPLLKYYEVFFADREDFRLAARCRDLLATDSEDSVYVWNFICELAVIERHEEAAG